MTPWAIFPDKPPASLQASSLNPFGNAPGNPIAPCYATDPWAGFPDYPPAGLPPYGSLLAAPKSFDEMAARMSRPLGSQEEQQNSLLDLLHGLNPIGTAQAQNLTPADVTSGESGLRGDQPAD